MSSNDRTTSFERRTDWHLEAEKPTRYLLCLLAWTLLQSPFTSAQPERGGTQRSQTAGGMFFLVEPIESFSEVFAFDVAGINAACLQPPADNINCTTYPGGLSHVAAGVGLRNRGAGTIALRGIPDQSVLVAAWVYWGVIRGTGIHPAPMITFEGVAIPGELVGTSPEPCWKTTGNFEAFRAPVTDHIQPLLNGDYAIRGVPSALDDGRDWNPLNAATLPLAEGASLVVVYSHAGLPPTSRVYLHDGAALLTERVLIRHNLSLPLPSMTELRHTRIAGDGQIHDGSQPTAPIMTYLGWDDNQLLQTSGPGSPLNPNSEFSGEDGNFMVPFWNTNTSEVYAATTDLQTGHTSYQIRYEAALQPTLQGPTVPWMNGSEVLLDCVGVVAHAMTAQ